MFTQVYYVYLYLLMFTYIQVHLYMYFGMFTYVQVCLTAIFTRVYSSLLAKPFKSSTIRAQRTHYGR